jgi:hypothetical protein
MRWLGLVLILGCGAAPFECDPVVFGLITSDGPIDCQQASANVEGAIQLMESRGLVQRETLATVELHITTSDCVIKDPFGHCHAGGTNDWVARRIIVTYKMSSLAHEMLHRQMNDDGRWIESYKHIGPFDLWDRGVREVVIRESKP